MDSGHFDCYIMLFFLTLYVTGIRNLFSSNFQAKMMCRPINLRIFDEYFIVITSCVETSHRQPCAVCCSQRDVAEAQATFGMYS